MRKLIWTVLASTLSAAAAGFAVRALAWAWQRVTKQPPPLMSGWTRFLIGKPLNKQITQRVHPQPL